MHLTSRLPKLQLLESWNGYTISPTSSASSIPFAEHIETWRLGALSIESPESPPATIQFPVLTSLELKAHLTSSNITPLFSQSLFPKLTRFTFNAPPYDFRPETADLYKESWLNLCSLIFKQPLEFLSIRKYDDDDEDPVVETQMPLENFFASVKTAHPLTTLWMAEPRLLKPLTNSSIDRLCTAFPKLTDLYLHCYASTLASFEIVALLAQRLPQLKSLDIGIDGSSLSDPPTVPILSHRLETLCLQNSMVGYTFWFARYIDRLFPFATIKSFPLPDDGDDFVLALKLIRDSRKDQEVRSLQENS